MHHPVDHPLVAHAHHHPDAERLAQTEALIADIERASSALVHDMNDALTRILGRTQRLMRGPQRLSGGGAPAVVGLPPRPRRPLPRPGRPASRPEREEWLADLQTIDHGSRELAGLSHKLHAAVVTPSRRK